MDIEIKRENSKHEGKGMINENVLSTLKIFYEKLINSNVNWILSGSTSLAIQGVDVYVKDDIDIITDRDGSFKIDSILSKYRVNEFDYNSNEKYQSYFGIYKINGIKVEIMGEFQYKLLNGEWSKPNHYNEIITRNFHGMQIPMLKLEQELVEYENTRRPDKVEKIKECLKDY